MPVCGVRMPLHFLFLQQNSFVSWPSSVFLFFTSQVLDQYKYSLLFKLHLVHLLLNMGSVRAPLEYVQACWARVSQNSPVYKFFFSDIELISASNGTMVARLPVAAHLLNSKGGLHGSVSATIVDWAGGMAIASTGMEKTGVSTDIHVSYVSTAKLGDTLTIEGNVSRVGKNMGFTTVTIYKGDGEAKSVVAHGTHTKYILRDQEPSKGS